MRVLLSIILALAASTQARALTGKADAEIRERVERALRADPGLDGSRIRVRSVRDGVVHLTGRAKTTTDDVRAMGDTARVPGVVRIVSEVQTGDTENPIRSDDQDTTSSQASQESDRPRGPIEGARDTWITSATRVRLLAAGRDVSVHTREGEVTLFGVVPSAETRRAAEEDARKVPGVRRVVNHLQVVPPAKQEAVKAHDDAIGRSVRQAIADHSDLRDARIDVDVKNGVAHLEGSVPSTDQLAAAVRVARATRDVRSVENDLRIEAKPSPDDLNDLRVGSRPWPRTAQPPWLSDEETKQ